MYLKGLFNYCINQSSFIRNYDDSLCYFLPLYTLPISGLSPDLHIMVSFYILNKFILLELYLASI